MGGKENCYCKTCGYSWTKNSQVIQCPDCGYKFRHADTHKKKICPNCKYSWIKKENLKSIQERLKFQKETIIPKDYFTDILIDLHEISKEEDLTESGDVK